VGISLAAYSVKRIREIGEESRTPEKPSGIDRLLLVLIAVPVALALIGALAPPTAKDTLLYHFSVPKTFIAQHGNAFVEVTIASLFTADEARDDSIKTHFFEQAKFPTARFTVTKLPQLEELPPEGETADYELAGTLVRLGDDQFTSLSQIPHGIVSDRVYMHAHSNTTLMRCLALNSARSAIINSWISDCHDRGGDSQAIAGSGEDPRRNRDAAARPRDRVLSGQRKHDRRLRHPLPARAGRDGARRAVQHEHFSGARRRLPAGLLRVSSDRSRAGP
jgi:hypothetical protein